MQIALVDRVLELHHSRRIVTTRRLDPTEYFFQNHFPLQPMMPGSFLLEAIAQTATLLVEPSLDFRLKAFPITVMDAKFRRPVVAGPDLRIELEAQSFGSDNALVRATALQNGVRCAVATMGMATAPMEGFYSPAHLPYYLRYYLKVLAEASLVGFPETMLEELQNAAS